MFEIRRSKAKGRGLFATAAISPGTVISVCPVLVLGERDFALVQRTTLGEYVFRFGDEKRRACVAFGPVSMCNHDDAPNAELVAGTADQTLTLIARTPIGIGDEITLRYRKALRFTPA